MTQRPPEPRQTETCHVLENSAAPWRQPRLWLSQPLGWCESVCVCVCVYVGAHSRATYYTLTWEEAPVAFSMVIQLIQGCQNQVIVVICLYHLMGAPFNLIKVLVAPKRRQKCRIKAGKKAIFTGKDYHCGVNEKQNKHQWWSQSSNLYLLICRTWARVGDLSDSGLYSHRGKNTYMHVHVLGNSSEHAFLPENDKPVKHSAVMSSWLPGCLAGDFKLASYCQGRMWLVGRHCLCVRVHKCVRVCECEWVGKRQTEIKTGERARYDSIISMQRCTEAALIWCICCTATHTLLCTYMCTHKNTPTLYMFMTHCLSAGNKAGSHPAEWSQPTLSPTKPASSTVRQLLFWLITSNWAVSWQNEQGDHSLTGRLRLKSLKEEEVLCFLKRHQARDWIPCFWRKGKTDKDQYIQGGGNVTMNQRESLFTKGNRLNQSHWLFPPMYLHEDSMTQSDKVSCTWTTVSNEKKTFLTVILTINESNQYEHNLCVMLSETDRGHYGTEVICRVVV